MTDEKHSDTPATNPEGQPPRQPPVTPPAPLQGALPDNGKRKADDTKNEADELAREFRVAEKWVIGTNIILAIIGIFALCIYNGQLTVMRGQLGEIIKQYPELQKSADAAKGAAKTAEDTLKSTQQQFRTEQRPYLWADPQGVIPNPNGGNFVGQPWGEDGWVIAVKVRIRRGGQSPAIGVTMTETHVVIGPKEEMRKKVGAYRPSYTNRTQTVMVSETVLTPQSNPRILTKSEVELYRAGKWEAYIFGGVTYRDIFSPIITPYETTYCFQLNPFGLPFADCNFGKGKFGNSLN